MIVTLELGPEELDALRRRAAAEGTDVEAVLHGLIAALMPRPVSEGLEGDPEKDPEERAERDRERAELRANLSRWRAEQGRPPAG